MTNSTAPSSFPASDVRSSPSQSPRIGLYKRMWKAFPRDIGYLGFLAILLPTAYALLWWLFWTGVGSLIVVVGFFLVLASLPAARLLGDFELKRIRWAQADPISPVGWNRSTESNPFLRAFTALSNPHYWLYLLHGLAMLVVGGISVVLTFAWMILGVGLILSPVWVFWLPVDTFGNISPHILGRSLNLSLGAILVISIPLGFILLAFMPFITRGFVLLNFHFDRLLLGGFRVRELEEQVNTLAASRTAAVAAEGAALRRLERDIHDGPQQRLVRLQMDLAAAERKLASNPTEARELLDGAMAQSKEALEELRALSRGFAPPILLDRGLIAALQSLSDRSSVPVRFTNTVPTKVTVPQELARNAYFIASELLTNAVKHSNATEVNLELTPRTGAASQTAWLDVTVTDNGHGEAVFLPDHGLAGLDERVHGLGGIFTLLSPAGGPTVATAHLPMT